MGDKTIVFTVSQGISFTSYSIATIDPRGRAMNRKDLSACDVYKVMLHITETLNQLGYAVLYEVV